MQPDWSSMPTDLDELYADLSDADYAGDDATAQVIAKRIKMVESANAGNVSMEDEYGTAEKFMVGLGRGAMDLAQGAKQKALMAGEAMGLVDEGRAKEYTGQMNEEIQRFEDDFKGIGAESVGRFAGWAAPAALTGGAGGMLPAIGVGALEGGIMPTESSEPEEAIVNAVIGAGIGAGGKALQYGLQSKGGKQMIKNVADKTEELYNRYRPVSSLQDEFIEGVDDARKGESVQWDILSNRVGDELVDDIPIYEAILDEVEKLQKSGGGAKTIQKLQELWDDMPRNEDDWVTWNALKEFRSNFAAANKDTFVNEGMPEATVKRLYDAVTDQMKTVVRGRDMDFWDMAMDATQKRKNLLKQSKAKPDTYMGSMPRRDEEWFRRTLTGSNEDQVDAVTQLMTKEGRDGAKAFILQNITKDVLDSGGTNMNAATKYKGMINTINKLFDPDEAAEVKAFVEFLDVAKSEKRLQTALRGVMQAGSVVGAGKAGLARLVLPSIMRNKETKAILRKLATTKKGTKLYHELTGALSKIFTQGAVGASGAGSDPYEITIRDGVPQ